MFIKSLSGSVGAVGVMLWAIGCASPSTTEQSPLAAEDIAPAANAAAGAGAPSESTESSVEEELASIDAALTANPNDVDARARALAFNERADLRMGLIHTVDMGEGRTVKLYRRADGTESIGQFGPADAAPVFGRDFKYESFAEVYAYLKPGAEMPAALIEADLQRADLRLAQQADPSLAAPAELPGAGTEQEDEGLVDKHGTSACSHFQDEHRCRAGDGFECLCNRTNGGTSSWSNVQQSFHMAAAYRGTISFEMNIDSQVFGPFVIAAGNLLAFNNMSGQCSCPRIGACSPLACPRTHGQRVFNSDGDGYHRHICLDNFAFGGVCS